MNPAVLYGNNNRYANLTAAHQSYSSPDQSIAGYSSDTQGRQPPYLRQSKSYSPKHLNSPDYSSDTGYSVGARDLRRASSVGGPDAAHHDGGHGRYRADRTQSADVRRSGLIGGGGYSSDNGGNSSGRGGASGGGYNSDAGAYSRIDRDREGVSPAFSEASLNGDSSAATTSPVAAEAPYVAASTSSSSHKEVATVASDDVEIFYIDDELWNVYESEGYPYYLRMSDNHSQWDDPREAGVKDEHSADATTTTTITTTTSPTTNEEPSAASGPASSTSSASSSRASSHVHQTQAIYQSQGHHQAPIPTFISQPLSSPGAQHLMSPTMTSSERAGVGAQFIKVDADSKIIPTAPQPKPSATPTNFASGAKLSADDYFRAPPRSFAEDSSQSSASSFEVAPPKTEVAPLHQQPPPPSDVDFKSQAKPASAFQVAAAANPLAKMLQSKFSQSSSAQEATPSSSETKAVAESKDGGGSASTATSSSSQPTKASLKEDPELAKYIRMASVGVPVVSVVQKMQGEGVSTSKITQFQVAYGLITEAKAAAANEDAEPAAAPVPTKEELMADSELVKFVKMASFGVPPPSIVQKMKGEGVPEAKINMFEVVYGLSTAKAGSKFKPPSAAPPPRRTSVKMQKVHWNALSEEKLEGSVWRSTDSNNDDGLGHDDIKELEGLFGASESKVGSSGPQRGAEESSSSGKSKVVSLIDPKRSYNVTIALAQFRYFADDFNKLCLAVLELDREHLNAERVNNIILLLPTPDEIRQVSSFKGDVSSLGKCERFFSSIIAHPGVAEGASCFAVIMGFDAVVEDLSEKLNCVTVACDQVVKSEKLASLLKRVLAVGNLMNEGAGRPKASGITLDSLLKTAMTKGTDKKTTVLDYVVKMIGDKDRDDISQLEIGKDLQGVDRGSRVNVRELHKAFAELKAGLTFVSKTTEINTASDRNKIFVNKASDFLRRGGDLVESVEAKLQKCSSKVSVLCNFFAEDDSVCEASSIFGVLMQFISMVEKSTERYERKKKSSRADAGKAALNTSVNASANNTSLNSSSHNVSVSGVGFSSAMLLKSALQQRRASINGGGGSPENGAGGGSKGAASKGDAKSNDESDDEDWLDAKD